MASHNQVDMGYIKTLLFPELYNSDIPQPMSTQSYTRFTDKKEITFSSKGSGILVWYPKTNIGPQLWYRNGTLTEPIPFLQGAGKWKAGGYQDYSTFFT